MKTKQCSKCKEVKPVTEFWKDTSKAHTKNEYKCWCKTCLEKYNRKYYKRFFENKPWMSHYINAKKRCQVINSHIFKRYSGRGIKFLMSSQDFKELWFRDRAYLLKKPSIHRENNDDNYVLENCKFIELSENARLGNITRRILYG